MLPTASSKRLTLNVSIDQDAELFNLCSALSPGISAQRSPITLREATDKLRNEGIIYGTINVEG